MHLFVWGSILSWFVVIPFMSASVVYSGFLPVFDFYGGVALEVLGTATFWFYWPLAAMIALAPTIITRILKQDLSPHLVDDVRLLQNKEGTQLFTRPKIHRKSPSIRRGSSVHRTGYAFAQEPGFGRMIVSGRAFGLDKTQVQEQQHRRLSQLITSNSPSPTHPSSQSIREGIGASLTVAASLAISRGAVEVEIHDEETPLMETREGKEEIAEVSEDVEEMVKVSGGERVNLPGSVSSTEGLPNTEVVSGPYLLYIIILV